MVDSDDFDADITFWPEKQHVLIAKPIAALRMVEYHFSDWQAPPGPAGRRHKLVPHIEEELLDPIRFLEIEGLDVEGVDAHEIACGFRRPDNRHSQREVGRCEVKVWRTV